MRLISVKVNDALHKQVRIKAASLDVSIKDYITNLIKKDLGKEKA